VRILKESDSTIPSDTETELSKRILTTNDKKLNEYNNKPITTKSTKKEYRQNLIKRSTIMN